MRRSRIVSFLQDGGSRTHLANIGLGPASLIERARGIVGGSVLYQWLTAEPNAEMIVVNLRETYTVGPLIAMFDYIKSVVRPALRESRIMKKINLFKNTLNIALDRLTESS